MSTFSETAIVDYRLLFADKDKQISFSVFCSQQTNESLLFPFSISFFFRIYTYRGNGNIDMFKYIYAAISHGKRKPSQFSLICLPFAHCSN
jgi:hypothetical protein